MPFSHFATRQYPPGRSFICVKNSLIGKKILLVENKVEYGNVLRAKCFHWLPLHFNDRTTGKVASTN